MNAIYSTVCVRGLSVHMQLKTFKCLTILGRLVYESALTSQARSKEQHRQVSMDRMIALGNLDSLIVLTLYAEWQDMWVYVMLSGTVFPRQCVASHLPLPNQL